ncbi:glutathione S-transferase family protein [Pedomonas mirosovicensis]|uniref:glutathione S-transferase family protein n=1 Tax=Pedomonas mirosovicensis TaxID=2908641 RepID=UPI0021678693|nr:glutathione S-transferase family protein [Pedomonas mirosovicensis]MCH8684293.1 glutathione S-transferase family protein [Pedomonas mirosovicensis]
MKLYELEKAPNARRVRWFLAEKGMTVETQQIDLASGENLKPEYLAINPRGLIPTLVLDDGTVIDESVSICRYFEELHPEPNLLGQDAKEKALIDCWQRRVEFDGLASVALAFRNSTPVFANRSVAGCPEPTEQLAPLVERGLMLTHRFFDMLDKRLGESDYVAGDRFTIADITAFVTLTFARWIKETPGEQHAHIHRWFETVSARPASRA